MRKRRAMHLPDQLTQLTGQATEEINARWQEKVTHLEQISTQLGVMQASFENASKLRERDIQEHAEHIEAITRRIETLNAQKSVLDIEVAALRESAKANGREESTHRFDQDSDDEDTPAPIPQVDRELKLKLESVARNTMEIDVLMEQNPALIFPSRF